MVEHMQTYQVTWKKRLEAQTFFDVESVVQHGHCFAQVHVRILFGAGAD